MIDEAVEIANKADVIVAVVGESANMSGESASRSDINIPETQQELLKAAVLKNNGEEIQIDKAKIEKARKKK